MNRFAITGGIACGKSTVGAGMERLGWQVIDTDVLARRLLEPEGAAYEKVVDSFGQSILNESGLIDRSLLGEIVFNDPAKRSLLNSILHPLIRAEWQSSHSLFIQHGPTLIVIPLLFETGIETWFQSVACVGCSLERQRERLAGRGLKNRQAEQRIAAQWPMEEKLKRSHLVLWNDGSMELLEQQIRLLDSRWKRNL
ncbi:MAG: dephospho-CoA kinase [Blastochloris sp.]|nr:dephospho-CoA kinase [Blastochloris sp.]